MKVSTIKAITGDRELSEGAKVLMFLLLAYADFDTGECYPSNGELRRHLGAMSDRTLKRQIGELRDAGFLTTDFNHAKHERLIVVDLAKLDRAGKEVAKRPRAGDTGDTYSGDNRDTKWVPNRVGVGDKSGKSGCQTASGVGDTGDTPNKNTQENTPGTSPNAAGGGEGIKDSDSYRKESDPAAEERVAALKAIYAAAIEEFQDDGARWYSFNSQDLTGDLDLWLKAVRVAGEDRRVGVVIQSLPGFIRQKHRQLKAGPAPELGVYGGARRAEPEPAYLQPFDQVALRAKRQRDREKLAATMAAERAAADAC
jgi:hypothetical protein